MSLVRLFFIFHILLSATSAESSTCSSLIVGVGAACLVFLGVESTDPISSWPSPNCERFLDLQQKKQIRMIKSNTTTPTRISTTSSIYSSCSDLLVSPLGSVVGSISQLSSVTSYSLGCCSVSGSGPGSGPGSGLSSSSLGHISGDVL